MPPSVVEAIEQQSQFNEYKLALDNWRTTVGGYHDFYLSKQFTSDQKRELAERGLPSLPINRIHPIIDHQSSILGGKAPQFRVKARAGKESGGRIFDDLLMVRWKRCNATMHHLQVIKDMLIYGVGWWHVYVDPQGNFGKPHVMIDYIHPHDLFPDPTARRMDLRDARKVFRRSHMTGAQVKARWPHIDITELPQTVETDWVSSGYSNVDGALRYAELDQNLIAEAREHEIIEGCEMFDKPMVSIWDNRGIIRAAVPREDFREHSDAVLQEGFMALEYTERRVRMLVTCGDMVVSKGELPISDYPWIPVYNSHEGVVTGTSEILFLKAPQEARNAVTNLLIHYIATSTNAPWVIEENSTPNKDEFSRKGAVQGAVLTYRKGAQPPDRKHPAPLPQGFPMMAMALDQHMEYATAAYSTSQGDPTNAPNTFRGLMQLEEFSLRKANRKLQSISYSLERLGTVAVQMMQAVYTAPEVFRMVGVDGIDKKVRINILQDGRFINDVTVGAYDVEVVAGSTVASSPDARQAQAMEQYKLGLVTKRHWIMESDLPNKEQLIKELDELEQARGTLEQQQKQIRKLEIQLAGLEGEARRARRYAELKEHEAELESIEDKARIRGEEEKLRFREEIVNTRIASKLEKLKEKESGKKSATTGNGSSRG